MWLHNMIEMYLVVVTIMESSKVRGQRSESHLSTSQVADLTRHCVRNPTEPSNLFTASNPCDTETNCRFGGGCWKSVVNTTTHGKTMHQIDGPGEGLCRCTLHCPIPSRRSRFRKGRGFVCGTDGRTYVDECRLKLASCRCQYPIGIKWHGPCEKGPKISETEIIENVVYDTFDDESSGSGDDWSEIRSCGDGITCKYGAVCDVDAEDGPCLCAMACRDTSSHKVCGTDGRTYQNECFLKQSACHGQVFVAISHKGPCVEIDDISSLVYSGEGSAEEEMVIDSEDSICEMLHCKHELIRPVCGSDGNTYANQCSLRYEGCRKRKNIRVLRAGHCDDDITATRDNDSTETVKEVKSGPCDGVYCFHGSVCVPEGADNFKCSCDDICSKDSFATHQDSLTLLGNIDREELKRFFSGHPSRLIENEEESFGNINTHTAPIAVTPNVPTHLEHGLHQAKEQESKKSLEESGTKPTAQFWETGDRQLRYDHDHEHEHGNKHRRRHAKQLSLEIGSTSPLHRNKRSAKRNNEIVCGTDGKTYANECQMKIHACHEQTVIKIEKLGACPNNLAENSLSSTESSTSSILSTPIVQTTNPVTDNTTSKSHSTSWPMESKQNLPSFADTSMANTHTDSQTKSTNLLVHTEDTKVYDFKTTANRTVDEFLQETTPFIIASRFYDSTKTWLIGVVVSVAVVLAAGILLGAYYFKKRRKERSNISESEANSCETLVVASVSGSEVSSATTTEDDCLKGHV